MGHTVTIPANTTVGAGMLYDAARLVFETGSTLRLNGGGGGGSTGAFPQTIDYSWHIRGGLRGLNLNGSGVPDLTGGKAFAMKLGYDDAGYYNGNIGSQTWLNGHDGQSRTYTYAYDNADRLTAATYGGDTYTVNGITYDANGNIQTMTRSGVDQLSYRYDDANQSNKLLAVTDATSSTVGFSDGNTTGDDYEYYPDGSLKKDLNRGITDIQYNLLKLPRQLTFSSGKVVSYQYDAGGRKLKMTVSGGDVRDYVGPFQYLNGSLFEISHEEGRYSPTGDYEYFHKDHLGNVRVAFGAGGITQYTDYDPWGLPLWGGLSGGSSSNRNTFLNREAIPEVGYTDLKARFYDQQIGRFIAVDPLTDEQEMYSTYQYSWNNPILRSDPNGNCPTCPLGLAGGIIGGLVGGGIEAGMQLYEHGKINDWKAVGGATVQGAITGGVAGLTGGASLAVTVGASAGANVVGGAINRTIQGKEITAKSVAIDAAVGATAGVAGKLLNGISTQTKSVIDEKRVGHIFREAEGHFVKDTPASRSLINKTASNSKNAMGTDKFGNQWSAKTQKDGTQIWTQSRNGKVINAGINQEARTFNPQTGLSAPTKPN